MGYLKKKKKKKSKPESKIKCATTDGGWNNNCTISDDDVYECKMLINSAHVQQQRCLVK